MADPSPPLFQRLDQSTAYPYARGEYARRFAWRSVERLLVRTSPARCFAWRAWWLRRFGAVVGASGARPSVRVWHPWLLEMGDHSILGDNVEVYNLGRVTIGSHTVISQGTYLCAGTHDYTRPDLPLVRATIAIGSGVWIGAQAFIGPGVTIGDDAIVGARAVVMKDVPPGVIVAGNPARVIKQRPLPSPPPPSPRA